MFDINITLIIQLVNFIVTIVVLNYLLIQPIRAMLQKRRDLASGMLRDAESFNKEAAAKLENYEAALTRAREEAALTRDIKKREGVASETELMDAAYAEAQKFLQTSREETRKSVAATMETMEKRVPELAKMATAQLLGKSKRAPAA